MKEPAHVAYDAYRVCQASSGQNVPTWESLVDEDRDAWRAAARALLGTATEADAIEAARWSGT